MSVAYTKHKIEMKKNYETLQAQLLLSYSVRLLFRIKLRLKLCQSITEIKKIVFNLKRQQFFIYFKRKTVMQIIQDCLFMEIIPKAK